LAPRQRISVKKISSSAVKTQSILFDKKLILDNTYFSLRLCDFA